MSSATGDIILEVKDIYKDYEQGAGKLKILRGLNLAVKQGEALCIVGASGSGKSTLLHIMGTLDRPSSGQVFFEGQDLLQKNDEELALFRNQSMGFVFQFHHLLAEFNALENVMLPARIGGESKAKAKALAQSFLELVGLKERMTHFPNELSGGELQRVAIARALVRRPRILFADEPTGNLDSNNGLHIQNLFFQLKEQMGITLVVVTHDLTFARKFGKTMRIADGVWTANDLRMF
jgi:lipoprotein-releasing system ATP-binding protein